MKIIVRSARFSSQIEYFVMQILLRQTFILLLPLFDTLHLKWLSEKDCFLGNSETHCVGVKKKLEKLEKLKKKDLFKGVSVYKPRVFIVVSHVNVKLCKPCFGPL